MKRTLMGVLALGFFGAMVGVGCGSDPEQDTPDDTDVALDAFADEYIKLDCNRIFECCDAAELDVAFTGLDPKPKNEAECAAVLGPFLQSAFKEQKAAVMEGRQEYDGMKAARCFKKIKSQCGGGLGAGGGLEDDPDCQTIFVGKVADGGACKGTEDCSSAKSTCYNEKTCRPRGAAGEACAEYDDCTSDYCKDDVCFEKKANGQACKEGGDCQSERCDMNTSKCTEKAADGEACTYFDECKSGNCDQAVCAAKKADGAACNISLECKSDNCDFDTQVCKPAQSEPSCDGK